ncbi:Putative Ca2+/H+ antiporter, TMEM165/GDT1 family [Caloranaerobacter azorensis DSM 13643]|uniref:GDT1 family protein n=1 Tax=Caloranaerobacter azorensis DSM 13643 TaxID=1121264 RepID=A0A1M5R6R5_9FIRM|nr:TMEM165/GDT1 family protein [Caloranaerobacter azorensis]SHH22002.1 Putative Ca2+/H+ antiporter, TMEM165/GDT1 family [Caloranaerobacter azorensis DSM 13643]
MIREFIRALFLIFMAEMGDKTQILAMSFATQFSIESVLLGVFIGSFLNHGLAVILGTYLSSIIPVNFIQILAGFLFIGFALWTLYDQDEEGEGSKKSRFGPVLTVALAFFIGELGDKTQLTAITLSIDAKYPFFILLGTVTGMVLTSILGIYVGSKLSNKISGFTLKILSAAIFMFFGVSKLYSTLPKSFLTSSNVLIFILLIIVIIYMILKKSLRKREN